MTRPELGNSLALVNALLNGTSALCILGGRLAIARGRIQIHRRFMLTAVITSAVFLTSYLTRVALTGTHVDPHHGWVHHTYLAILVSHMILAMVVVPLVLVTLWRAYKKNFAKHRAIAKVTFPIWLYVSVTGVLVYVMLYLIPV